MRGRGMRGKVRTVSPLRCPPRGPQLPRHQRRHGGLKRRLLGQPHDFGGGRRARLAVFNRAALSQVSFTMRKGRAGSLRKRTCCFRFSSQRRPTVTLRANLGGGAGAGQREAQVLVVGAEVAGFLGAGHGYGGFGGVGHGQGAGFGPAGAGSPSGGSSARSARCRGGCAGGPGAAPWSARMARRLHWFGRSAGKTGFAGRSGAAAAW